MSTAVSRFIEDAVKGGWKPDQNSEVILRGALVLYINNLGKYQTCEHERILLDPLAWQAVSDTRQWKGQNLLNWHRFIDHLADGKTIEEALISIE